MARYTFVYGGEQHLEAENIIEAYAKFWAHIRQRIDDGRLGMCTEGPELHDNTEA